jgi:hypothetical protein
MKIASASGESDAGARAVEGEDEKDKNQNGEENGDDQKCSTVRHRRQFRQDYKIDKIYRTAAL